jgi:hypothetical protein
MSLAHVWIRHQSSDSDYALLIAELKRSIGSFLNGNSMPCRGNSEIMKQLVEPRLIFGREICFGCEIHQKQL